MEGRKAEGRERGRGRYVAIEGGGEEVEGRGNPGGEEREECHTLCISICCAEANGGRATQHWDSSRLVHQLHTHLLGSAVL